MRDSHFMTYALELARARLGKTAPNPAVGCVIVSDADAILGEGATGDGGRPHAEEIALGEADQAARGASVYVTLEPCAIRTNRALSCAERLVEAGVARVIIGAPDPHPNAGGAGLIALRAAGIEITEGVMEAEARALNAGFFRVVEQGLPLVRADADSALYDAAFHGDPHSDLRAALTKLAKAGMTRLCVPPDSDLARALAAAGLLD